MSRYTLEAFCDDKPAATLRALRRLITRLGELQEHGEARS